ncbi:ROK family transcriptional regulator [Leifsonia xyli subsp. xyli]|uniref:Transcriptional regulator, ROK family n=2 Tax=Leifsonia xyli subsp. xyli TaxID=59736 RepID=Q6AH19_LEIXX|nr:ROK family transcriptional regulator [Leifsonia xyli]AAT88326.1 transcriptional regulator, ROK family [Leifsonia xyli subsp. xyli str. CTCB07]ODA89765.1 ROK family transcriptional regulator [Leifsonia xyli subsp. xyli]
MTDSPREPGIVATDAADLLAILRDGIPRTRAQLAELTGLARSTIAVRIDSLTAAGLVAPAGDDVSTGGRPPARIRFNPGSRVAIAIDLGATHGVVALADLAGNIMTSESQRLLISDGPEAVLDWAIASAKRLYAATGRPPDDLIGIGIGVPGPVEHSTGLPVNPPIMAGWDRFGIPAYVRRVFDVPVLVDNDVNLLALGEHALIWPDQTDILFVKVATGIGAGIISGGRLQRGAQGSAGDLSHVRVPFGIETPSHGAQEADLEALASGPAIARTLTAAGVPADSSDDVVALARTGSPAVLQAIRQAGRDLGEVIATCVNLLNPSLVIVGGSLSRVGEQLLAGVREVVYHRSTPLATQHLTITQSRSGETGGAIGAAIMVIQHALDPETASARSFSSR